MTYKAIMIKIFFCGFLLLIFLSYTYGEDFNLFGEAGQAYSVLVNLGHPPQKFNLLVDTGSTTLAIASQARQGGRLFFETNQSNTIWDSGKRVQAKYSQGMWVGHLASDVVQFPSLPNVPEVRTDLALITESHKFFMNGSGWQGLLGLAYLPVGAWGENVVVESWLDSVDHQLRRPLSFQLKLCGARSTANATHYGNLEMLDYESENKNDNQTYRTPVLRKRWYEVGVLSVRVMNKTIINVNDTTQDTAEKEFNNDMCLKLNEEKSIVDSGTTNIRLPDTIFREIVGQLKEAVPETNVISDEFWYHGEAGCWPQPQEWSLPWIAIDLLSDDADNQYFTIEIPPQNYMRVAGRAAGAGFVCYKLGLEAGPGTVLGYTAMEGLQVLFNRSAGWIGWQTSDCGPDARITGPYNVTVSLRSTCSLVRPVPEPASIRAAQWALCGVSIIALAVLVYLLAPCFKVMCRKSLRTQQISLSQAALVERET